MSQPNTMEPGMEPQVQDNTSTSRTEFLVSLSSKVDAMKELITRCSSSDQAILDGELQTLVKQLETVIRSMAMDLSKIPFSDFKNQFSQPGQINVGESPVSASQRENNYEDFIKGIHKGMQRNDAKASSDILPPSAETLQPGYQGFFCPLTEKIMNDPVTIETGITYEREAIVEWFMRSSEYVICPTTRIEIKSTCFCSNLALKSTIEEWKERNEVMRIQIASGSLSLAASEAMVLDALKEMQLLSQHNKHKGHMHIIGITQQVVQLLRHDSMVVRCEAMHLLRSLVEDEDGKVIVARTRILTRTVKMMSSYNSSERHAAVSFLLELSKSEMFLDKIGLTPGGILILITMKYNKEADPLAAEKAEEVLKNLEKLPLNIRCMAENGFMEPLLDHLIDGLEEVQMDMVSYLGEIPLEDDMKSYVAERASNTLIQMISGGNPVIRREAFKTLVQISSHPPSSRILIDAGITPLMIDEIFSRRIHSESLDSQEEAAAILANILESDGIDFSNIKVNKNGHTISSQYSVYNLVHLLKCSIAEKVDANILRILFSLTKLSKPLATIVSVVKELEVTQTIIEFLNSQLEDLVTVAAKLLIALSSHIGDTIASDLTKTQGQPEGLIKNYDSKQISEKQAASANLIAKLPHRSAPLNLALLHQGTVPVVLSRIQEIQRGEIRASSMRLTAHYLEGLAGILVRFTSGLLDQEILQMAMSRDLTSVFADLLVRPCGSSEVQRLAAVGLENLSSQSLKLSKPPLEVRKPSRPINIFSKSRSVTNREGGRLVLTCPAHRGVCSTTTFCLLESRAAERLLGCLDNENPEVVKAVLSAISTLLDNNVEVTGSVRALTELGAVESVFRVLKVYREEEEVLQRSLWLVERFLEMGNQQLCREIYSNKVLSTMLVSTFHKADGNNKKMAENILRHLHRIMNFSSKSFVM
ncbi:putative U-box domain-containing protein 42 isoform X1 [Zingiber officinale]|uniref:putative U-box domain-containing protein 42 isoform X1 n=1 Tax=Zingiber officinale TaxID=94328 RepID=UPI001C4C26C3|nr:putative U-box domain-containing protein 42 isoform X1 [Zingiber officinale]